MTNPKLIFKGDKLFLIDAPEYSDGFDYPISKKEIDKNYQEAISSATRWKIKNGEEINLLIYQSKTTRTEAINPSYPDFMDWQPEQGKLYDVPKGYIATIENQFEGDEFVGEFAILIPQQMPVTRYLKAGDRIEIEESQDDLFELLREFVGASDSERWQIAKSKFKITRR